MSARQNKQTGRPGPDAFKLALRSIAGGLWRSGAAIQQRWLGAVLILFFCLAPPALAQMTLAGPLAPKMLQPAAPVSGAVVPAKNPAKAPARTPA